VSIDEPETSRQALQRSLSVLKAQQEATVDGILVVNEERRIVSFNGRFCRLWNVTENLMAIIRLGDDGPLLNYVLSHMKRPEEFLERVEFLYAHPEEVSSDEIALRDGRTFERYSAPITSEEGFSYGRIWYFRDVTERKRAEEALQAEISERKRAEVELERVLTQSEQIIASIMSILITVDEKGLITTWNAAAAAAFGLRTAQALGQRFTECGIGWDWDVILGGAAECTAQQKPVRLDDIPYRTRDGKERFLGVTLNPINTYSDEPMGFLLLGADITNRRVMEGQLAHAQKMESIGQLAAGIAHEINTPIQYVGDNTRFLQEALGDLQPLLEACHAQDPDLAVVTSAAEGADLDYLLEEIPRALSQSLEGIERVSHIVRAMKDFSHPGTAAKVMTDLNRALDSTITVARNEWKYVADLLPDFEPDLPLVPCLPADLNQVFLNMIVNAAHAIADIVGDGAQGKGIITVSTRRWGDWAEVCFSDTGTGMTEEIKARIFDPFFTTKAVGRGTGQGLAISHAVVVEKHKGTIHVESVPGRGTTFILRLPLSDTNQKDEPEGRK